MKRSEDGLLGSLLSSGGKGRGEVELNSKISGASLFLGELGGSGGGALERAMVSWAVFSFENIRGRETMVCWERDGG